MAIILRWEVITWFLESRKKQDITLKSKLITSIKIFLLFLSFDGTVATPPRNRYYSVVA